MANVDGKGQRISGQLVEFIGIGLDTSLFKDYVAQWLEGDSEKNRMIVAEYTIGYEPIKTTVYAPGKDPRQITMTLTQKPISGKNDIITFCWVSDIDFAYICRVENDVIYGDSCLPFIERLEITCSSVLIDITTGGGFDGNGDAGNGDDGGDDSDDGQGGGDDGDRNPYVHDNEVEECLCNDQRTCDLITEYEEYEVGFTPVCVQFLSGGSTTDFSWNEFMGHWRNGTEFGKHSPYGIMESGVMNGVQKLRDMDGRPIVLTSGYRCPKGNRAVGGVEDSYHMSGRAVDIRTSCNRTYYNELYQIANDLGFNPLPWGTYPDCHLHIDM